MTVILTPGYAPLEQYGESEDQQGPWTDLYAFGATLFHCLTGRPPRDAAWRIQASAHGVPDPIREALNPSTPLCSAEMVDLLCWMLMPLAKDRPQSCDEVAAHLYQISKAPAAATVSGQVPAAQHSLAISSTSLCEPPRTHQLGTQSTLSMTQGGPQTSFLASEPTTGGPSIATSHTQAPSGGSVIGASDAQKAEQALVEYMGPIEQVLVKKQLPKR